MKRYRNKKIISLIIVMTILALEGSFSRFSAMLLKVLPIFNSASFYQMAFGLAEKF